jgi:hypothetical protein
VRIPYVVASLYRVKPLRRVGSLRGNNDAPSSKSRQIRRSPLRQEVSEADVGLWSKEEVGEVREGLQQKCSSRGQTPHRLETTHVLQLFKTSKDYKKTRQVNTLACSYL